jgi:cytochrome P450
MNFSISSLLHRLYPPVPITTRTSIEDDVLAGHTIPGGTRVMISPGVIGRLPAFWEEPDTFKPERWLNVRLIIFYRSLPAAC